MSTVLHSVSGLSLSPADGVPPMVGGGPGAGGARQGRRGAVDGPTDARMYNRFIGLGEGAYRRAIAPPCDVRGPLTGQAGGRRPYSWRGGGDGRGKAGETGHR